MRAQQVSFIKLMRIFARGNVVGIAHNAIAMAVGLSRVIKRGSIRRSTFGWRV